MARYHSLCPPYFSSLFRKYRGISPKEFVQKLRMDRAKELLADDLISVKKIAAQLGYQDAAYFCKYFKEKTKMTTKSYRLYLQRSQSKINPLKNIKKIAKQPNPLFDSFKKHAYR